MSSLVEQFLPDEFFAYLLEVSKKPDTVSIDVVNIKE